MRSSVLRLSCSEHSVTYLLPGRGIILPVCQKIFFTIDCFLFLQNPCRIVSHRTCFGEGRPALLLGSLVRKAWRCLRGHWVLPRVRPGPCTSPGPVLHTQRSDPSHLCLVHLLPPVPGAAPSSHATCHRVTLLQRASERQPPPPKGLSPA